MLEPGEYHFPQRTERPSGEIGVGEGVHEFCFQVPRTEAPGIGQKELHGLLDGIAAAGLYASLYRVIRLIEGLYCLIESSGSVPPGVGGGLAATPSGERPTKSRMELS
jgi:hypothetical protein